MSEDENTERPRELPEETDELKEKRKELLEETDHIKLMLDTSIENGLFETYAKKNKTKPIKSLVKKFLSIIKKTDKKNGERDKEEDKKNGERDKEEDKKNGERDQEILQHLKNARKNLTDKKLSENDRLAESEYSISLAKKAYSKALYSAPLSWRFFNEYAGHIWIWLIGLLTVVFFIFYYRENIVLETNLNVGGAAISAVSWGVIGAVLRAMWFLKEKVADERGYRKSYNVFFISVPFLGGMLAAIVYLILFAGLSVLTNIDNTENISPVGNAINITNTTTVGNATGTTGNMTTTPATTTVGNATGTTGNMTTTIITNTTSITPADTTTEEKDRIDPLTIIPFAAFAGFQWEWAIRIFRGIGGRIR